MWQKIKLSKHLVPACLTLLLLATTPTLSPAQSLQTLQASAQSGDHSAQLYLGQLYDAGTKLPQDYAKARHWYELAAAANLPKAQNKLGQLLRLGLGGPVDLERAFDLTKQAATDGSAAHLYDLAQMYENGAGTDQDMAKAATFYQQAVELDHAESAVSLGVLYQNGTGVEQDYARARSLYEPAAAAGHPRAQNNLGLLYTRGSGVEQDYTRAAELFQAAANGGLSTAMTNLSVMYANGYGLPQSDALAVAWARQAKTDPQVSLLSDPRLADLSFDDPRAQQMLLTSANAGDPLSQYMLAMALLKTAEEHQDTQDLPGDTPKSEPLFSALWGFVKAYAVNLWFILRTTVPLMLLAGFLGSIVATLIPGETLTGVGFSVFIVIAVALVGVFLPVPIAFDVVLAGALMSAGLAPGYIMALLFTLGSFSIYSFFIVASSISLRAALLIGGVITALGIGAGIGAQSYYTWQSKRALDILLSDTHSAPFSLIPMAHAQTETVTAIPFTKSSPAADTPFTRLEGWEIGIEKPIEFSFQDMWPPFWEGRSLSSGDIDKDGDIDLLIASTYEGLYLYDNDGTGQFTRRALDLGPLAKAPVFNAALVDITGDGWLDIFVTTYQTGNYLMVSDKGNFPPDRVQPVANNDKAILSLALSFADADRDGDLDVALGNWAAGWYRRVPGEESRNRILLNDAGTLDGSHFSDLPGIPGETLSILFSDINGDGISDLLVGNDFEIPDYFYLGDGKGGFKAITYAQKIIPHTTTTTMAVKTADLLNDGTPEIYLAQIAGRSSGVSNKLKMQPLKRYCDRIKRDTDKAICIRNMAIKTWYKSGNNFDPTYAGRCATLSGRDQAECKGMLVKDLAIQQNDPAVCALIPADQTLAKAYCAAHFLPIRHPTQEEADAAIEQVLRSNVLLEQGATFRFEDSAKARGLDVGGWSWDTKIADFDNDGAQDVYIVNGTWVPNEVSPSNLFFHNQGDGTFVESSGPFGLEDYLMTAAATAFDMDGDGDLDMITHPVNGPITVFRNNSQGQNAIAFALQDSSKNRFGIGAVIRITTEDGITQSREIQLGGGFMSFDAPVAHFGLGDQTAITKASITWPDGTSSTLGPLDAGATYTVAR